MWSEQFAGFCLLQRLTGNCRFLAQNVVVICVIASICSCLWLSWVWLNVQAQVWYNFDRVIRAAAQRAWWRPRVSRGTDRLVLVCVAVTRPPAPPPIPTHPAAFDPKTVERFARSMAEGGPIIEELAMRNNVNNPNYRSVCF